MPSVTRPRKSTASSPSSDRTRLAIAPISCYEPFMAALRIGLLIGVVCLALGAAPPATTLTVDGKEADDLAGQFQERLHRSRYMESDKPREVAIAGWEGFPTK